MIQQLLVGLVFLLAVWYVGRMVYHQIKPKQTGCGTNCKCGVDFNQIEIKDPKESFPELEK